MGNQATGYVHRRGLRLSESDEGENTSSYSDHVRIKVVLRLWKYGKRPYTNKQVAKVEEDHYSSPKWTNPDPKYNLYPGAAYQLIIYNDNRSTANDDGWDGGMWGGSYRRRRLTMTTSVIVATLLLLFGIYHYLMWKYLQARTRRIENATRKPIGEE